jgi:cytochrome c556
MNLPCSKSTIRYILSFVVCAFLTTAFAQHTEHKPRPKSATPELTADQYAVNKRFAIAVTPEELAHVLTDMNHFMASVNAINAALATKDFAAIVKIAKPIAENSGEESRADASFHKKIPSDWRLYGRPMRKAFEEVAYVANVNPSVETVVASMGKVTQTCVGCHAVFRLVNQ